MIIYEALLKLIQKSECFDLKISKLVDRNNSSK